MTVVLIGDAELREFDLIADAVESRGGEAVSLDVREWPGETPLTVRAGADGTVLGTDLCYEAVTGVYVDSYNLFRPYEPRFRERLDDNLLPALSQLREHRGAIEAVARIFDHHGAVVIPRLVNQRWQDRKPWQLHLFDRADLPVPDTVFTNSPDEVRAFLDAHDRVVYKPVTRGGTPRVTTDDDLADEALDRLSTAPVQFQEYVEGVDLRVYVLDGTVVGAARYESDHFSFKLDVRDGDPVDAYPADIDSAIEETVTTAADLADLRFTAADVRRRSDGSHSLIELNEAPRFAVPDVKADQDVAGAIAAHLLGA
ncbi:ATP-grasp domain-containing protein [Halorussus amylolyticus]|uniref:ATP-grasp domain-containing protein n=1 Tax=Halorussus amylolyticus TaxID=1126242 RepID=UPI00138F0B09|nr:ATP-grasp domain-containing protein [Halorussus amylolyticus]